MGNPLRVLIIEDSEDDVILLLRELKRGGYDPVSKRVETYGAMREALLSGRWDLVISDYIMPEFSGLSALDLLKESRLDIPFIIVSGKIGEDTAVEAMKAGAHDYILKGSLSRLLPAVDRELRDAESRRRQKKAEEALGESEARFSAVAATATDAIIIVDSEARIAYWNPAAERIFGFSGGEALGNPAVQLIPERFREPFEAGVRSFALTGDSPPVGNTVEFVAVRRNGEEFPIEASLSSIQIGGVWHAMGIVRDITDRKRAEEELRRHRDNLEELVEERTAELRRLNEQLQQEITDRTIAEDALWKAIAKVEEEKAKSESIIAAIGDGIMIVDTDMKILYQNRIHRDLIGDHAGEYCHVVYYNQPIVCEACPVRACFDDGRIHKIEKSVTTIKGNFELDIIVSPLKDGAGNIIAGIEVVRDISERRRMEDELRRHRDHLDLMVKERTAELRKVNRDLRAEIMRRIQMEKDLIESQRFVQRIADATPNLLYLYDVIENRVVYINPRVTEILGYTPDGVKRMGNAFFATVLHPLDAEVMNYLGTRFQSSPDGDMIETEFRMKNSQDEWRWFYSSNVVFKRSSDGVLRLILGIAQDVTERKEADEELKSSREQLRNLLAHLQSVREDERARISREIHDELGQALTALKMDLAWLIKRLDREQKPVYEKALMMSKLIDMNIQTVKRISSELRPGLLDVLGLTAALEWQAEEFQDRTGIRCDLRISPEDIALERDLSTVVFRIFQETLTNVVRHADAKKVRVSLKKENGEIILQVKDDGKGITQKQISSPTSIGLMGMRERVHYFGGTVKISGVKGKGTTVSVSIPFDHEPSARTD